MHWIEEIAGSVRRHPWVLVAGLPGVALCLLAVADGTGLARQWSFAIGWQYLVWVFGPCAALPVGFAIWNRPGKRLAIVAIAFMGVLMPLMCAAGFIGGLFVLGPFVTTAIWAALVGSALGPRGGWALLWIVGMGSNAAGVGAALVSLAVVNEVTEAPGLAALTSWFVLHPLTLAWVADGPLVEQRHARGECERCGYSLTGLDGRVCPECGFDRANMLRRGRYLCCKCGYDLFSAAGRICPFCGTDQLKGARRDFGASDRAALVIWTVAAHLLWLMSFGWTGVRLATWIVICGALGWAVLGVALAQRRMEPGAGLRWLDACLWTSSLVALILGSAGVANFLRYGKRTFNDGAQLIVVGASVGAMTLLFLVKARRVGARWDTVLLLWFGVWGGSAALSLLIAQLLFGRLEMTFNR